MSRAPSEALVSPGDAAANAVSVFVQGAVGVAKKHPKITSTWAFGLALMVLGTGFTVSQSLRAEYEDSMERVDADYSENALGPAAELGAGGRAVPAEPGLVLVVRPRVPTRQARRRRRAARARRRARAGARRRCPTSNQGSA